MTLKQLVQFGKPPLSQASLRECALYARTELPIRLSKRVRAFQDLPFIVGTNPYIKEIYKLYYDSFETLLQYSHRQDDADDMEFYEKLNGLVEQHTDNIPILAKGKIQLLYIEKENTYHVSFADPTPLFLDVVFGTK